MCTAVSYPTNGQHFFGRNLDLDITYDEQVTVTPRNFPFSFRNGSVMPCHYALIGMATVCDGYPLYYEATNDQGLSMAGLNFPGNASYHPKQSKTENITPYELIPWILGQCADITQARTLLSKLNLWNIPFNRRYPLTPLHWLISDPKRSIVVEPRADGLKIYDDPYGILTNNPPFPYHMHHLANYSHLGSGPTENHFSHTKVDAYSNGMGAMGLPGDFSSASRFVKAAFVKENSAAVHDPISQFFHILNSVAMPSGCIRLPNGNNEITQYSCCCDTHSRIYYYTTYDNSRITAVQMDHCPVEGDQLITFPLRKEMDLYWEK